MGATTFEKNAPSNLMERTMTGDRMWALALVAWLMVPGAGSAAPQATDVPFPPIFAGSTRIYEPPPGADAWLLQIISRGGFTGRGAGDLIVASDGTMTWSGGPIPARPDALDVLAQRIRSTPPMRWPGRSRLSTTCSDCVATLVLLTVRDTDGGLHTYQAYWDSVTRVDVAPEILQIHDLALTLQQH